MFESIQDCEKIVLLIHSLFQNDKDLLREIGFTERDINHLILERKNILIKQHEEYLYYVKDQEEGIVERFFNK